MGRQEIGQGVAVKCGQKSPCGLTECTAQDTTLFNSAKPGMPEAAHHGQIVLGFPHDRPYDDFPGRTPNLTPPLLPRTVSRYPSCPSWFTTFIRWVFETSKLVAISAIVAGWPPFAPTKISVRNA